ncbi:MAG TPA: aminotransferase class IV [Gammaproteobacteria bacterium]|nr:aminotransferase class IV [Gammaproteobacteria bacterium]
MDESYAAGCAWVDGEYVPIAQARIPLLDMGFSRSDCTYDVVAVWQGGFFRLEDHLDRFERSCACLQLAPPPRGRLREILFECVRRSGLRDAYVEAIATRGVPRAGQRDPRRIENRFYAYAIPYVWIANPDQQATGLRLVVADSVERISARAVDPTVKNFHWGDLVRGQFEAYDRAADTIVLLDREGHVTEGPGFNLFAYVRGTLLTPADGILQGITRRTVLELAERERLPTRVTRFGPEVLREANEIFLTSTAGGVMPVVTLDGRPVGTGRPGTLTERLRALYWDAHRGGSWVERVDY